MDNMHCYYLVFTIIPCGTNFWIWSAEDLYRPQWSTQIFGLEDFKDFLLEGCNSVLTIGQYKLQHIKIESLKVSTKEWGWHDVFSQ